MFDFESALRTWRKTARRYGLSSTELDELEDHLHCTYVAHVERGVAPGESFATALRSLGLVESVSSEFRKVRSLTWHRLLKASWVGFAVSFLLPVVEHGITLFKPDLGEGLLPGFQAIRFALEEGGWYAMTALTNAVMLTAMWRASRLGRGPVLLLGLAALASTVLNGVVWLAEPGAVSDLRPGYYLWLASFGVASTGLLMRARALRRDSARALLA
jgi:hypothetical protein